MWKLYLWISMKFFNGWVLISSSGHMVSPVLGMAYHSHLSSCHSFSLSPCPWLSEQLFQRFQTVSYLWYITMLLACPLQTGSLVTFVNPMASLLFWSLISTCPLHLCHWLKPFFLEPPHYCDLIMTFIALYKHFMLVCLSPFLDHELLENRDYTFHLWVHSSFSVTRNV